MPGIDEAWVRKRAHEIWEAEGRPEGKDFDHWYAATEEFRGQAASVPAKKPAAKKAAAEKPAATVSEAAPAPAPKKRAPAAKKQKA